MVREIVHIQVGQCGNQIGKVFWETTCYEHHLDDKGNFEINKVIEHTHKKQINDDDSKTSNKQSSSSPDSSNPSPNKTQLSDYDHTLLDKIDVYFHEVSDNKYKYVPRAIMVDLEPGTGDAIRSSRIGNIFKPDNFIMGASGCANNWAKGRFTEGLEVIDEIMDLVRKEVEEAECVQAFQLTHSLGGGTGSGLGTLLLSRIRDSYFDRITCAFSVYPSPNMSDVVVEPYNTVLSVCELIECADQSFTLDNEALVRILQEKKVSTASSKGFDQYNELISYVMSGITSSLRFPGQLNGDLRKMSVNLTPFPRLHFFVVSQAPLLTQDKTSNYTKISTQELTSQVLDYKSYYVNMDPENGKFLTASILYRGAKENISTFEVDKEIAGIKYQAKYYGQFVGWIPNNFKYSLINVPAKGFDSNKKEIVNIPMTATFIANHTAIKDTFSIFMKKYKSLYKKKAFLHWYFEEGMDEENFHEASTRITDLIQEYQDKTNVIVDYDNPDASGMLDDEDFDEDDILAKYSNMNNDDDGGEGGGDDDDNKDDDGGGGGEDGGDGGDDDGDPWD